MKHLQLLIFLLLFFGCRQNFSPSSEMEKMTNSSLDDQSDMRKEQPSTGELSGKDGQVILTQNQPGQPPSDKPSEKKKDARKMIKTVNMQMEVDNYKEARTRIDKVVEDNDATITSENENRSSYRLENTIVIRVKPEALDKLITELEKIASIVDRKNVDAKDVTEQFIDITSRLKTKREVEARYRDILRQAKSIPDILAVEERLRMLVEEIESMEGRLKYLNDQVGFSTVTLNFYETFEQVISRKKAFWKRIGKSVGEGWNGLQEFLIGMVSIWPFILILGGLLWWGRKVWKRRKT